MKLLHVPLLLITFTLSGCDECKQSFSVGEMVHHKLTKKTGIVLKQASIENYEGYCLVDVRFEDGRLIAMSVEEIAHGRAALAAKEGEQR